MKKLEYNTNIGSLLVIMITAETMNFIAEVIQSQPLILKVEEEGPFSRLRGEDFIVWEGYTLEIQGDEISQQKLLKDAVERGHPFVSGLHSLNVKDGKLHQILPV